MSLVDGSPRPTNAVWRQAGWLVWTVAYRFSGVTTRSCVRCGRGWWTTARGGGRRSRRCGAELAPAASDLESDPESDADSGGDVRFGSGSGSGGDEEIVVLARRMLDAVPLERSGEALSEWADVCSVSALRIHQLLDPLDAGGDDSVAACRAGRTEGASHLVAAELRRQVVVLELLAQHGASGVRQALGVSTEGRRVLRAVVSRRARGGQTVNLGFLAGPVGVLGPGVVVLRRCRVLAGKRETSRPGRALSEV